MLCAISPLAVAGNNSGLMTVSAMLCRVRRASPSNSSSAACRTKNATSVFGTEQFTLYMLMWSAL